MVGAGLPLADALKLALAPAHAAVGAGCVLTTGIVHSGVIVVVAVALLFGRYGSTMAEETIAVLLTVPLALASTFTTRVKVALPPALKFVDRIHLTVPVPPTDGTLAVQPEGDVADTNVVPDGMASESVSGLAAFGPPLFTVMEYVTLLPALTGSGESIPTTDRSACDALSMIAPGLTLLCPAVPLPLPLL